MAPKRQTPTVRLRRLAAELRRLRSGADLTREDVSEQTSINNATLYRIETARARPQKRTLITLLNLYEVDQEQREYLVVLLRDAGKQGWLRPYHSDLPEEYTAYISFEAEAASVRNYETSFIPGLLQKRSRIASERAWSDKASSPRTSRSSCGRSWTRPRCVAWLVGST